MKTIAGAGGVPIACEVGGRGPNLVLVHGAAAFRGRWAPVRPALEAHFTVTAIDRRGRGDSGDGADYAIEREFDDVAAVVAAFAPPVLLFGHSFGAVCALEAAMRTDRLAGLILYEPPIFAAGDGGATEDQIAKLEALLAAGDREGVVTTFMRDVVGVRPRGMAALKSSPVWPARVAAAHTLPRELHALNAYRLDAARLGGLATPVRLLLGGASPPPFANVTARLQQALPNAGTVVLPGQQHVAMDSAPDLVVEAVVAFWRAIAR
jgi:pimeloyl-ACP methyl ester carboxylesterase